jgi:hypothetical protein
MKKIIIYFISLIFIFVSCATKSEDLIFKEVGTLLWVNNVMPDSVIKVGVKEMLENSSIVIAQISWSPSDSSFIKNPEWYHSLAIEGGKSFMLNIDWMENERSGIRGGVGFDNEIVNKKFKKDIKNLVELYKPDYLTLGVEVNYYALTSPEGYKSFIKLFNELKKDINSKYPNIKIGLSFQLELLYGIHHDWKQNKTLEPLNAIVENLDYIGISTYPDVSIHNKNKSSLFSLNYLDSISNEFKKPIGVLETGISSNNFNENQRISYVKSIYKKTEDLNLKFLIWGSIIDDNSQKAWKNNLGLIDSKGNHKPEFYFWKQNNNIIINN